MSVELFRACSRHASIVIYCSSYHVSLRTVIAHTGHSIRYFLLFSCPRCPRRPFSLLGLPHGQMRALYLRSQTSIHWLCNICHLDSARLFGVWLLDASKTRAICKHRAPCRSCSHAHTCTIIATFIFCLFLCCVTVGSADQIGENEPAPHSAVIANE